MTKKLETKSRTCWNNDDRAEESDLGVGEAEPVDSLGQLEHAVHEELGVARRHGGDRLPPDDVPV